MPAVQLHDRSPQNAMGMTQPAFHHLLQRRPLQLSVTRDRPGVMIVAWKPSKIIEKQKQTVACKRAAGQHRTAESLRE